MINKKQLAAVCVALLATAAATASVSAGTYTSAANGWDYTIPTGVSKDRIQIEKQADGNHVLRMRGDGSDNIIRAHAQIKANGADYTLSMKYCEHINDWVNNARLAEKGGGRYDPYDLDKSKTNSWKKTQIGDTDWYDYVAGVWYENKNPENYWFNLLVHGWGSYSVDDVMVQAKDSDIVLFYDDFETEIENVTQTRTSISWEIPEDAEYEELKIYRETDDGKTTFVKSLDYGVTTVTAEELGSFEGTYILKPVKTVQITMANQDNKKVDKKLEMDGEKVVVLKDAEYGMGLYNGATELTSLQAGTYTAKAYVKNNKVDDGIGAQLITILKKDGKRIASAASEVKTAPADETKTSYEASITIPDLSDGEYELSMFLWDSLEGMKRIIPSTTISE